MNRGIKRILCMALAAAMLLSCAGTAFAEPSGTQNVKVGVAKADVTGPITDISTGYNSLGDLMEGLLTRLYARAFVIDAGQKPQVYVSVELVHMTESIKPGVIAMLKERGYTCFSEENVMLTATHCHSSTSNTSWFALYDLINGVPGYDDESYELIVKGIADAIAEAYESRVDGTVSLVYGQTDIKASNRSADAFLTNLNVCDYGYEVNEDGTFSAETGLAAAQNAYNHEMAGIILSDSKGNDLGFLNFFGSHGTSNGIDNTYVASDHKGYAALKVEQTMGDGFVAAFAQADSGDTSPNAVNESDYHEAFLRPNELAPSLDVIENQISHGRQEADAAIDLIRNADRTVLDGDFSFNYTAVDFSDITVDLSYVGDFYMPYDDLSAGYVETSEPCIGAGIIAGDEEGAPVDNAAEGAVKHNFVLNEETGSYERVACDFKMIDLYGLQYLFKPLWPLAMKILQSDEYDDEQMEKVVCLAVGSLMQKVQPLQIMRMGSLAIAGVPFELTFEQANRIKAALEDTLAPAGVDKVIIATHANAYSQYVTTREEYAAQHYEGATCLFGPWSGAALTQELDKLAQGIVNGTKADKGAALLQKTPLGLVYTTAALTDPGNDLGKYGQLKTDVGKSDYKSGEWVMASFGGVNPRHITMLMLADDKLVENYTYMEVQKLIDGEWTTVMTDSNPYTVFKCVSNGLLSPGYTATVGWLIKGNDYDSGTYRLVYNGIAKTADGLLGSSYKAFSAASSEFTVERTESDLHEHELIHHDGRPASCTESGCKPYDTCAECDYTSYKDIPALGHDYVMGKCSRCGALEEYADDPFVDTADLVPEFRKAILWAVNNGVTAGVDETHFAPNATCTRGQAVTFIWRAAGCPEPEIASNIFSDIAESSPFYKAALWANENGIALGYADGTFKPEAPCTRAHVAAFLWRWQDKPAADGGAEFSDVASLTGDFRDAIAWANASGVTVGYPDGTFRPAAPCTRAHIVTFIYRCVI